MSKVTMPKKHKEFFQEMIALMKKYKARIDENYIEVDGEVYDTCRVFDSWASCHVSLSVYEEEDEA